MEPAVTWNQVKDLKDETELLQLVPYIKKLDAPTFCVHVKNLWSEDKTRHLVDVFLHWGTAPNTLNDTLSDKYQVFKELLREHHDKVETHKDAAVVFNFEEAALKTVQSCPNLLEYTFGETNLTVINTAVQYGSRKLFRTLIDLARERGDIENFGRHTRQGKTPLQLVVGRQSSESKTWDLVGLIDDMLALIDEAQIDEKMVKRAIREGKGEMMRIFIQRRPKSITRDATRHAISSKDSEMLSELLKNCKDIFYGHQVLHFAISVASTEDVRKILLRCPELAVELDQEGDPPMKYIYNIQDKTTREELREVLVPFVVRHASTRPPSMHNSDSMSVIGKIRNLLGDPQDNREDSPRKLTESSQLTLDLGREITLDLGGFRHSKRSIEPFLKLITKAAQPSSSTPRPGTPLRLDFESTLRYVDIPVPDLPRASRDSGMVTIRSEVEEILDWLRNINGVKGIYELRVTDSLYIPHSEGIIKKCLTGFDIEILDWKRVDMSIEPLFSGYELICPNLQKLTLYASGWASLQYWTSQEVQKSLREFPKLREVQVIIEQDLIGYALSKEYEERSKSNFDKTLAALGQPQGFTFNVLREIWAVSPAKEEDPHGPRKCTAVEVTRLGGFLSAYRILQHQFLDESWRAQVLEDATPRYMPHIKVAIIDTGVDPGSIQCSQIRGSSFVSSDSSESPWWFSQHPHGTQMAKIITELDPFCQLLVAKVGDFSRDMTGERVKKAFDWAAKVGADIISFSAAFFNKIEDLDLAVSNAVSAGIVVIASTAGEGYNQENAYPADYDSVLKIAATTGMGKETEDSVTRNADFLFPGQNLVAETTFLGTDNWPHEVSGASVATAIAAGVASLVLACHRLASSTYTRENKWDRHNRFRRKIVVNAFKKMCDKDAKYVRPWTFFQEKDARRSWGEAGSILRWLHDKCHKLET